MRNLILSAALVTASLFGMTAQAAEPLEAGKQYVELGSAVPVAVPGKIEVVELFWYGCPHCYAFEPTINPWVEKLPADVNFVRIPAMFGGIWNVHGQLYITLEAMGVEHKVHKAVFEAIHGGKKLATPEEMAEFLVGEGVDKDKFLSTYNSFAVKGKVEDAKKKAQAYQISGVPTMVVNGKYRFDLGTAGGPEGTLSVADQLIAKERAAKQAAYAMRRWGTERLVGLHDPQVNEHHLVSSGLPADSRLRLLSFNIQVGISTERYRHYLTRSWQHLLPHTGRADNLQKIGNLLGDYDLVALQEADGGSLRSGYVNQVEHLAQLGAFPYWYQQLNRNLGRLAQHSNGVLSRLRPWAIEDHPLPGPKGRGAILVRFGEGADALVVVMMHLALGARVRTMQLAYIRELIGDYKHQVLMGDMNTHASDLLQTSPLRDLGLLAPQVEATFPSWRPQRCLDHILLSPTLTLERVEVLAQPISDHLPVAVEIRLPGSLTVDALPALSPALRGTPE